MSDDIKQVIVMRNDLNMRKGKMIAQGAHASIAFLTRKLEPCEGMANNWIRLTDDEQAWVDGIFTKICVKVNSEEELMAIDTAAREAGLTVYDIWDRGLTEF